MKSSTINVPVSREDFRVFAAASRLVKKSGTSSPTVFELIQFQLAHRTAEGVAKDYLDSIGEIMARRLIRIRLLRPSHGRQLVGRLSAIRSVRTSNNPGQN